MPFRPCLSLVTRADDAVAGAHAVRQPDVDMCAVESPEADDSGPRRPDAGPRSWPDEGDASHSYLYGAAFGLDAQMYHLAEHVLLDRDARRQLERRDGWEEGRRICTDPYVGSSACSAGDAQSLHDGMWIRDDVSVAGCSRGVWLAACVFRRVRVAQVVNVALAMGCHLRQEAPACPSTASAPVLSGGHTPTLHPHGAPNGAPPTVVFLDSHFPVRLASAYAAMDVRSVKRLWAAALRVRGVAFSDVDWIVLPLHLPLKAHWVLCVLDRRERQGECFAWCHGAGVCVCVVQRRRGMRGATAQVVLRSRSERPSCSALLRQQSRRCGRVPEHHLHASPVVRRRLIWKRLGVCLRT